MTPVQAQAHGRRSPLRRAAGVAVLSVLTLAAGCGGSTAAGSALPQRAPASHLVAQAALAACPPTGGGRVSGGLPAVTLPCLGGSGTVRLAGLRGPALVNIWASDCGPCRQEAPALQRLYQKTHGRVLVLGIDDEPQPNLALHFAIDFGLHYPMVYDEHGVTDGALHVIGTPTTFFVGRDGRLAGPPHMGALPSGAALTRLVSERLGVAIP